MKQECKEQTHVETESDERSLPFVFNYTKEMDEEYIVWAKERAKESARAFQTVAENKRRY